MEVLFIFSDTAYNLDVSDTSNIFHLGYTIRSGEHFVRPAPIDLPTTESWARGYPLCIARWAMKMPKPLHHVKVRSYCNGTKLFSIRKSSNWNWEQCWDFIKNCCDSKTTMLLVVWNRLWTWKNDMHKPTSYNSSSCSCKTKRHWQRPLCSTSRRSTASIADLAISAALPWITVFTAWRSAWRRTYRGQQKTKSVSVSN